MVPWPTRRIQVIHCSQGVGVAKAPLLPPPHTPLLAANPSAPSPPHPACRRAGPRSKARRCDGKQAPVRNSDGWQPRMGHPSEAARVAAHRAATAMAEQLSAAGATAAVKVRPPCVAPMCGASRRTSVPQCTAAYCSVPCACLACSYANFKWERDFWARFVVRRRCWEVWTAAGIIFIGRSIIDCSCGECRVQAHKHSPRVHACPVRMSLLKLDTAFNVKMPARINSVRRGLLKSARTPNAKMPCKQLTSLVCMPSSAQIDPSTCTSMHPSTHTDH
eukprot:363932-Chlamydomonas_euryale.AAC.4